MREATEANDEPKYATAPCQVQLRYGLDTWDSVSRGYGFFRANERLTRFPEPFYRLTSDDRDLFHFDECRERASATLCGEQVGK